MPEEINYSTQSQIPDAFAFAFSVHRGQNRKGNDTPYISHLMSVASMVYEMGGGEIEVIAALLHDAVEDRGGQTMIDPIREQFGEHVLKIVLNCSDSLGEPKPPWKTRKTEFLEKISSFDESTLLVVLADKIHNARSTLLDLKHKKQDDVWGKFKGGKEGTLWYYRRLDEELRRRISSVFIDEFTALIEDIHFIANQDER